MFLVNHLILAAEKRLFPDKDILNLCLIKKNQVPTFVREEVYCHIQDQKSQKTTIVK